MDIYVRVSRTGERTDEEATADYIASCYEWAGRHDVIIGEIVEDTDVSGSVAVAERGLEALVQRVESGESDGIVTPWLDRLGRDTIQSCQVEKRVTDAGGKLIAVRDGYDSSAPNSRLLFQVRAAIAEDYNRRIEANFRSKRDARVQSGAHVHQVKVGYRKGDDGHLVKHEAEAKLIRELFERRAAGEAWASLTRWLDDAGLVNPYRGTPYTQNGVKTLVSSRTYLGEVSVPSGRKGQPRVIQNAHPHIVTVAQFEAANAIESPFWPRTQVLSLQARLRGLVWCAGCGRRMAVSGYGRQGNRKATYACTRRECTSRASIRATKLDGYVEQTLRETAAARDEHLWAVIEGSSAYTDALEAVEEVQAAHDELRDDIDAQRQLGIRDWTAALRVRKDAIALARKELSKIRRAAKVEVERGDIFDFLLSPDIPATPEGLAELVARVEVGPGGGRDVPAADRVQVWLVGASV
jgi:site-specific DNA recombinase